MRCGECCCGYRSGHPFFSAQCSVVRRAYQVSFYLQVSCHPQSLASVIEEVFLGEPVNMLSKRGKRVCTEFWGGSLPTFKVTITLKPETVYSPRCGSSFHTPLGAISTHKAHSPDRTQACGQALLYFRKTYRQEDGDEDHPVRKKQAAWSNALPWSQRTAWVKGQGAKTSTGGLSILLGWMIFVKKWVGQPESHSMRLPKEGFRRAEPA